MRAGACGGIEKHRGARAAPTRPCLQSGISAARAGARDRGRGADYPPYAEVGEFDTFLVEIDGRARLMQCFHQRGRLANDVQRWNDRFNAHGACPRVFD